MRTNEGRLPQFSFPKQGKVINVVFEWEKKLNI